MPGLLILAWLVFAASVTTAILIEPAFGVVIGRVADTLIVISGSIIVMRTEQRSIGWILVIIGISFTLFLGVLEAVAASRGGTYAAILNALAASLVLFIYLILIFPTGRLPSTLARVVAWAALIGGISLSVVEYRVTINDPAADGYLSVLYFAVLMVVSVLVHLVQLKHRSNVERKQLKWFLFALSLSAAIYIVMGVLDVSYEVFRIGDAIATSLWPIAILIAITRFRLYEIDRIVSRTVSYLVVVGFVAGVYFAVVAGTTALLPVESSFAVAASTLVVAALFNPVRRRVQRSVDRRFNRARYEAQSVVEGFTGVILEQTDVEIILNSFAGVASEVMNPTLVGVWDNTRKAV